MMMEQSIRARTPDTGARFIHFQIDSRLTFADAAITPPRMCRGAVFAPLDI